MKHVCNNYMSYMSYMHGQYYTYCTKYSMFVFKNMPDLHLATTFTLKHVKLLLHGRWLGLVKQAATIVL